MFRYLLPLIPRGDKAALAYSTVQHTADTAASGARALPHKKLPQTPRVVPHRPSHFKFSIFYGLG